MSGADRNSTLRCQQYSQSWAQLNTETTKRQKSITNNEISYSIKKYPPNVYNTEQNIKMFYLDGVILVKSSPIVFITLRPQIHKPIAMPNPP